jgi:hypothetical protein
MSVIGHSAWDAIGRLPITPGMKRTILLASPADRRQITATVKGYLAATSRALGAGSGQRACDYVTPAGQQDLWEVG